MMGVVVIKMMIYHFKDKETEAQRDKATCSREHRS